MGYYFFFSYSRSNDDPFLQEFFKDLSQAIRDAEGLKPDEAVGFFDQREIKLGAEWDGALVDALQTCPALVSIYSPAYFKSENCGKEWQVFHERSQLYREGAKKAGQSDAAFPGVIKPVIWIPGEIPAEVGGAQYTIGPPSAAQNKDGVKKMRKQYGTYATDYDNFVAELARQIIACGKINLSPLPDRPEYKTVAHAFPSSGVETRSMKHFELRTKGPKSVKFVFVAGSPDQFPQSLNRQLTFYLPQGGSQWKPFHPRVSRPILPFVQHIASEEGLDFYSEELPFSEQLPKAIRDAECDRSLVVLLVDSWTIEIPEYKKVLERFDEQIYFNCSVLIPWNTDDQQTVEQEARLRQNVRKIFRRWSRLGDSRSFYFCETIQSSEELARKLREILSQLTVEVIDKVMNDPGSVIPRAVESGIEKPRISNTLGQGGG